MAHLVEKGYAASQWQQANPLTEKVLLISKSCSRFLPNDDAIMNACNHSFQAPEVKTSGVKERTS